MALENPQWLSVVVVYLRTNMHHLGALDSRCPKFVENTWIYDLTKSKRIIADHDKWQCTSGFVHDRNWPISESKICVSHFSQVSPFRNWTQIIINQISNRIKSNQHGINSNHVAIFVRCQELFAWAPIWQVFFYMWLYVLKLITPKIPWLDT